MQTASILFVVSVLIINIITENNLGELMNFYFPARIGTFEVCPTAQTNPKQTSKEPILPTLHLDTYSP